MTIKIQDSLNRFIKAYEAANNSHVWANVAPFIAPNATYWFTDGSYSGIAEIQGAIQSTFDKIQDEVYTISNLEWPVQSDSLAVCTYRFHWQGTIDGIKRSGTGRGTNVLTKSQDDTWQIVHEHLSV